MDKIIEQLEKIKEEITDASLSVGQDDHFVDLVKLKNVEDELYETLILIHSSHKSEIQAIKSSNLRTLHKIIDSNMKVYKIIEEITKNLSDLTNKACNTTPVQNNVSTKDNTTSNTPDDWKSKFFNGPKNVIFTLWGIAIFFIMIWSMYAVNPEAAGKMFEFIKIIYGFWKGN